MQYELIGSKVPAVEITLDSGETVYTRSGSAAWTSGNVECEITSGSSGLIKDFGKKLLVGENGYCAAYTAREDGASAAFACDLPGTILPIDMTERRRLYLQRTAFLCAEESVISEVALVKRIPVGIVGGDGFVLQRITGEGMLFAKAEGDIVKKKLAEGETMQVEAGHIVAFDTKIQYELHTVKDVSEILMGGGGLFTAELTGPGTVILQTHSFVSLAMKVMTMKPKV